jgi:predicted Rossmann fold nucleotide-binding protein DprA/Smf involved in DNA uptake
MPKEAKMLNYKGNKEIMKMKKTGFLCSRTAPETMVEKAYEWAVEKSGAGECAVCGNYSHIERDVFEILLKGSGKIILVAAWELAGIMRPDIQKALDDGRLLIVSPFGINSPNKSHFSAEIRNKLIVFLSNDLYIAHTEKGGTLERIISGINERVLSYRLMGRIA